MKSPKIIVIGIDAPIAKRIKMYAEEGKLPAIKKLIDNGVWAEHCLVPHPTITPPNWTTIATGASIGTHQITCFHNSPDDISTPPTQAFDSRFNQAEYIWESAEREGRFPLILNWPTSWPSRLKKGIQIGGAGLHSNELRWEYREKKETPIPGWDIKYKLADGQVITTSDEIPLADIIKLKQPKNWKGEISKNTLEAETEVGLYRTFYPLKPRKIYFLFDTDKNTVSAYTEKDISKQLFEITENSWSDRISLTFETDVGTRMGYFKVKCERLDAQNRDITLYFSPIGSLYGLTFPENIAHELEENVTDGLFAVNTHMWEAYSPEIFLNMVEEECKWISATVEYLFSKYPIDTFFMHEHGPDHFYHYAINRMTPIAGADENDIKLYTEIEEKMYIAIDKMIGKIHQLAGDDAIIAIVSDHGATPTRNIRKIEKEFLIPQFLADAGLLKFKNEEDGTKTIDYENSLAIPDRSVYIHVNLKSKFKTGCVDDNDYEKVQDKIIEALQAVKSPFTNRNPFAFILRKQDARLIGLYGDGIGDVIFACNPDEPGEHGRQITTGDFDIGSIKGLLLLAGEGIKKGVTLERTVNIMNLTPTLCYLADIPFPAQCEGAIIYQALENPNKHTSQAKKIEKLQDAIRASKNLTHSY